MSKKEERYEFHKFMFNLTEDILLIMEHEGITKAQLAKHLGRSKRYVDKIFSGDSDIKFRTFIKIIRFLGYSVRFEVIPNEIVMHIEKENTEV